MKLPLPALVLFLLSPLALSSPPSPPHSVCGHKKTSLTGWLALPHAQHHSPHPFFFFMRTALHTRLAPFRRRFKLQVASKPA